MAWSEPIDIVIPCTSRVKKWAFDNAWTLLTVLFFFLITWGMIIVEFITR